MTKFKNFASSMVGGRLIPEAGEWLKPLVGDLSRSGFAARASICIFQRNFDLGAHYFA
jgi:hypothetical protein